VIFVYGDNRDVFIFVAFALRIFIVGALSFRGSLEESPERERERERGRDYPSKET
jgi:hypothetical protein